MTILGAYPSDRGILSVDELSDMIEHLSTEYLSQPENLVKVKVALREYERCRRLLEQQQKDFSAMILDVEEKSRLLEEEAATMRERCTQAEQELAELKADAAHNSDQLQQELQMYKSIAEVTTSTSNSALSTKSPVSVSLVASAAHSQRIQELTNNISTLGRELDELSQRAQSAECRAHSAASRLQEVEREALEALEISSEATVRAATLESHNHELKATLMLKDSEIAKSMHANSSELDRLRSEAVNRSKELAVQAERIQTLSLQVTSLTNELTIATKGSAQKLERIAALESRISFIATELDARNQSVESLTAELHDLTNQSSSLQTELNDARRHAADADLMVSVVQKERDTLSFTLSERVEQLATKSAECAKLREEVDQLYTQVKEIEDSRSKAELSSLTILSERDKIAEKNAQLQHEYDMLTEQYSSSVRAYELANEKLRLKESDEQAMLSILKKRNDLINALDPKITFTTVFEMQNAPEIIPHENGTYVFIDVYNSEIKDINAKLERQHTQIKALEAETCLLSQKLEFYHGIIEKAEASVSGFGFSIRNEQLEYSELRKELLSMAERTSTYVIQKTIGEVDPPKLATSQSIPTTSSSELQIDKALSSSWYNLTIAEIGRVATTGTLTSSKSGQHHATLTTHAHTSINNGMQLTYDVNGNESISRSVSASISPRLKDTIRHRSRTGSNSLKTIATRVQETKHQHPQSIHLENTLLKTKLREVSESFMQVFAQLMSDPNFAYTDEQVAKIKEQILRINGSAMDHANRSSSNGALTSSQPGTIFAETVERAERTLGRLSLFDSKGASCSCPGGPINSMEILRAPNSEIVKEYIVTFPAKESTVYHIHFDIMKKRDAEAVRVIADCYTELFYTCQYQSYAIAKLEEHLQRVCNELKHFEEDMRMAETVQQQANSEFLITVWDLMRDYINVDSRRIEILDRRVAEMEQHAAQLTSDCTDSILLQESRLMRSSILQAVDKIAPFIMVDKTDLQYSWSPNESPEIMDKIARLAITLKQQTDEIESVDRALCGVVHALNTLLSDETGNITNFKRTLAQIKSEVLKSHSRNSRRAA
ncbi:Coiled-coil protein [Giardia lamblia P15]|uniref:Coiled-coil protein n=1 Tax=Giardia intestinalis (strain P15) TaxID=658858 RepID=E1F9S7_GIAIA|nr:Coiled-coil protein [Giardia lamblia P15]